MSYRLGLALVAAGTASSFAPVASAEVLRSPADQQEVDVMRRASPHALALLEMGEEQAKTGDLEEGNRTFESALGEYKAGALLLRRHCETLTAMGRRDAAVKECYRALETSRANENIRATVRALVSGPHSPTMAEVALALDLAAKTNERAPGQLTPAAAICDIAASLGDGIMLRHCANALERIAPEAPETRQAMALLASRCPPWRFWSGAAALSLALAATGAHSMRRARRTTRRGTKKIALAAGVLAMAMSAAHPASADVDGQKPGMLSKWAIDDENPERSIPSERARSEDPLEFGYWLQDVILRAEVYSKHGKHDTAVKLYTALAVAVPERAVAWTKMCDEYEAMGQLEKARASCEAALLRDGLMVKDYEHYVHLVLASDETKPLTERQTTALDQVLTHMREDPAGRTAANALEGEVANRLSHDAAIAKAQSKKTRMIVLAMSIALFAAAAAFIAWSAIKARAVTLRA